MHARTAQRASAMRIVKRLKPAEQSLNAAMIEVFAVGTAMLQPRADGSVHPLEAQAAVRGLGLVTSKMFEALEAMSVTHDALKATTDIYGYGDLCTPPGTTTPHADHSLHVVAAAA